jgi:hypothetical protein
MLPSQLQPQFRLFHLICVSVKRLADRVNRDLLERELREHDLTAPKAIDNAIVNYVRIVSGDRIARTTYAALRLLADLRAKLSLQIPRAWGPGD